VRPFGPHVLDLDLEAETRRIAAFLAGALRGLRRRGLVVAVSGGVDSGTCLGLAVRAVGAARVFALLLPERDSSPHSRERGLAVCEQQGVAHAAVDIAPILAAAGCYARRDEAIRQVFPDYGPDWKAKIVLPPVGERERLNIFRLVVQSPDGEVRQERLPLGAYLQIVAATNFKQRTRKMLEYFHADRLNYAVVGTPNRLEYDQGFFVKGGDGLADVKPIAHLYKTQVYALARHLGLPEAVATAAPSTDTYSMPQGQDEFYFALPYGPMDLCLWASDHGVAPEDAAPAVGLTPDQVRWVYKDIQGKRQVARYLHGAPIVLSEPLPAPDAS
jgi:NAD+ synthase